jgi:hypothetical protein
MMIVSDVSVEMVEQLQEVLDAKAAEMASYREHVKACNSHLRLEGEYKSQLDKVVKSEQGVKEARYASKLKQLDGQILLCGDPPTPFVDTSPTALAERDEAVLNQLHRFERECVTLRLQVDLYRKALEKKVTTTKAYKEARERLDSLIKKHGYIEKAGSHTKAVLDDGHQCARGGWGACAIVVHPLYEGSFDVGNYNVKEKKWILWGVPPWALLDLSEF